MEHVTRIVYTSQSATDFSAGSLGALAGKAAAHNESVGITGVLLFGGGRFLQLLEGDGDRIESLYRDKIMRDRRHTGCEVLLRESGRERLCPNWSMGCLYIREAQADRQAAWERFSQALVSGGRAVPRSDDAVVGCIAEFIQSFGDEVDRSIMSGWLQSLRDMGKAS